MAAIGLGIVLAGLTSTGAVAGMGELRRWGGFDASGTTPGAFHDPQGLGVDRTNNDVFVLDRTSVAPPTITFRVQEFTPAGGRPIATGTFTQSFTDTTNFTDFPLAEGVAVDPALGRLYVLILTFGSRGQAPRPAAARVLAFSYSGTRITSSSAFPGGVLAGPGELQGAAAASDLYLPQGIATDPTTHDVVIDASRPDTSQGGPPTGPVILQRIYGVAHTGHAAGTLGPRWTDPGLLEPVSGSFPGGSVSVGDDGAVYVYQGQGIAGNNNLGGAVARIAPNFGPATTLVPSSTSPVGFPPGVNPLLGSLALTDISGTVTGYGRYFDAAPDGTFVGVYDGPNDGFTSAGVPPNVGYRRLDSLGGDLGIVGGGADGQICNIDTHASGVAAGTRGSFYVLLGGDSDTAGDTSSPRELIEFGPGGAGCPLNPPFAAFNPIDQTGHEALQVARGTNVVLDARVSSLGGAQPTEVDWDTDGDPSTTDGPHHDGFDRVLIASGGRPAPLTLTTRFTELNPSPGNDLATVPLRLQIKTSDGQTSQIQAGDLLVRDQPAVASFQSPSRIRAGQTATLDASSSFDPDGGPGATPTNRILKYQWDFGDGSPGTTTASPRQDHVFAVAGVYTVTLSVADRDTGLPFSTTAQVAVAPSGGGGPAGSTRQGTSEAPPALPPDDVLLGVTSGLLGGTPTSGVAGASASSKTTHTILPGGTFVVGSRGALRLPVGCVPGPECIGTIGLRLRVPGESRDKPGLPPDQAPVWLDQGYYGVAGGHTRAVSLRLGKAATNRLRRRHSLSLVVAITETAPASGDLLSAFTALAPGQSRHRGR